MVVSLTHKRQRKYHRDYFHLFSLYANTLDCWEHILYTWVCCRFSGCVMWKRSPCDKIYTYALITWNTAWDRAVLKVTVVLSTSVDRNHLMYLCARNWAFLIINKRWKSLCSWNLLKSLDLQREIFLFKLHLLLKSGTGDTDKYLAVGSYS